MNDKYTFKTRKHKMHATLSKKYQYSCIIKSAGFILHANSRKFYVHTYNDVMHFQRQMILMLILTIDLHTYTHIQSQCPIYFFKSLLDLFFMLL